MSWILILANLSIWIILLPAVTGILLFRRLDYDSRIVLLVVMLGSIPQVLRFFITDASILSIVYNVYTPLEFLAYWMLFRSKIVSIGYRYALNVMAIAFLLMSVYLIYESQLHIRFLNEWVLWSNVFQVIWICLCLLEYYNREESVIDLSQPFFWFLVGITCYAPGTAIFFSLWHFIKNHPDQQFQILNSIHHIFNILLYVFFTIGILKNITPLKYRV